MRPGLGFLIGCLFSLVASESVAQFDGPAGESAVRLGEEKTQRFRVGLKVKAAGGTVRGLYATIPVPAKWPEQDVRLVDEDTSVHVKALRYRVLEDGVRQMLVQIPLLAGGAEAHAILTLELTRRVMEPPTNIDTFQIPQRPPRDIRKYLGSSPYIETRSSEIQRLAKDLFDKDRTAWRQVEVIYDHVREVVQYKDGPLKGALQALRDGEGDCEELTSLFIALCRANDIPARTVWVPGHCYPEFYLEDKKGEGHWFPCQAAGTRAFGGMPDLHPILQKGDNFKVPEKRKPQRYVAEFLKGIPTPGGGRPQVEFIREAVD